MLRGIQQFLPFIEYSVTWTLILNRSLCCCCCCFCEITVEACYIGNWLINLLLHNVQTAVFNYIQEENKCGKVKGSMTFDWHCKSDGDWIHPFRNLWKRVFNVQRVWPSSNTLHNTPVWSTVKLFRDITWHPPPLERTTLSPTSGTNWIYVTTNNQEEPWLVYCDLWQKIS